jgi:demethylmenaquinone methyltransferase/2-methoxy-6-polyprenyl-1,4-benzoquinol methylase
MRNVPDMFNQISPSYDRINRILSLGLDASWRKKLAEHLPEHGDILDLATGTGDLILALLRRKPKSVIGVDPAEKMLELAKKKLPEIEFIQASGENLPFSDQTFNAITCSFGVRNVADLSLTFKEMLRTLKPKGKCLILEFSLPPKPFRFLYLFYLRHILPHLGKILSKHRDAYRYLNQTIETFPSGKNFATLMENGGFQNVQAIPMALGAVHLYIGEKP